MTKEYPGSPISVIEFVKDQKTTDIILNEDNLREVLCHPDVRNRSVCVVSIVGSFRKGKSFMLNCLLRYLYANYPSVNSPNGPLRPGDWMSDTESPLTGFAWKSGTKRETVGILFWSDVFLCNSNNGLKSAIILMDTQGMFDNLSTDAENSKLFSICTLISSLQIYNLTNLIQQDQLQHLQFATAYAQFAAEKDTEKTFQHLLFLIRDWYYSDEQDFGFEGGKIYLDGILEVRENQHSDLTTVREFIKCSFEKLSCFLMPPPGNYVVSKSNFGFSKCEPEFLDSLKVLVPSLLGSNNIVIKKFNNKFLDGAELFECIKIFVETFKPNDSLPEPQSIFSLTVERSMSNLIEKCMEKYLSMVKLEEVSGLKSQAHVYMLHSDSKSDAIQKYEDSKKMGSVNDHKHYRDILDKRIEEEFDEWREIAISLVDLVKYCVTEYKTNIKKEHVFDLKTVEDTQRAHERHSLSALDSFRVKEKAGTFVQHAAFFKNLEFEIEKEYKRWSDIVLNLQSIVNVCLTHYTNGIKSEPDRCKTDQDLDAIHDKFKKTAYEFYDKSEKKGEQKDQDLFKQNLQEEISIQYQNWKKYMTILMQRYDQGILYYKDKTTKKLLKSLKVPGDVHKYHNSQRRLAMEYMDQSSLAPKEVQSRYKGFLESDLENLYVPWKEEVIERIHRDNSKKCFCFPFW